MAIQFQSMYNTEYKLKRFFFFSNKFGLFIHLGLALTQKKKKKCFIRELLCRHFELLLYENIKRTYRKYIYFFPLVYTIYIGRSGYADHLARSGAKKITNKYKTYFLIILRFPIQLRQFFKEQ